MGSRETQSDRNREFWDRKLGDRIARPLSPNDAIRDALASEDPRQRALFGVETVVIEREDPSVAENSNEGEV